LLQPLGLGGRLQSLLGLAQQSVLHHAGVMVEQRRSLSPEVLQDLKTCAAEAVQVPVARWCGGS
jgi:hypothetical protein